MASDEAPRGWRSRPLAVWLGLALSIACSSPLARIASGDEHAARAPGALVVAGGGAACPPHGERCFPRLRADEVSAPVGCRTRGLGYR